MSDSGDDVSFGPWLASDLTETVSRYSGDGSDDDIDRVGRLGRSVCRLTMRRWRQTGSGGRRDAIAIFLLHPSAPEGGSAEREPLLGDGGVEVCGKIWFVNATAQSGRSVVAASIRDDSMFKYVDELGLSHVPAVVLNPKVSPPVVRIYRDGLGNDDSIEAIELVDREVSLSEIRSVINEMHDKHLVTPEAQVPRASMWANASKLWAASNAEAMAQVHIKTALSVRLFDCDIRHEQTMRAGRCDIEVVQQRADGSTVTPAEIEVKVLRERNRRGRRWSDKQNEWWVRRGVGQAAAYRNDRRARWGILWCFDMRAQDRGESATFSGVKCQAAKLGVALQRSFLYNSAQAWQTARYGT